MPDRSTWTVPLLALCLAASGCKPPAQPLPPGGGEQGDPVARLLDDHVQEVVRLATGRELEKIPLLVDATSERLHALDPGAHVQSGAFISNKTRHRVAAYLRCAVLATGDPTWCDELQDSWTDEMRHCKGISALWTLVGLRAIREGEDCASLVALEGWLPLFVEDAALGLCESMSSGRPDECPWPEGTEDQVTCLAVAHRDGSTVCHEVDPDKRPDWWPGCCERFTESFVTFISPSATPGTSPAMGAASGDVDGCREALASTLRADLAPFFHGPGDIPPESELSSGESACRLMLLWKDPGD